MDKKLQIPHILQIGSSSWRDQVELPAGLGWHFFQATALPSLKDYMEEEEILFVITVADVQHWAEEKLGRRLTYEELQIAKDKLEWGLSEDIDMVYSAIFEEMK